MHIRNTQIQYLKSRASALFFNKKKGLPTRYIKEPSVKITKCRMDEKKQIYEMVSPWQEIFTLSREFRVCLRLPPIIVRTMRPIFAQGSIIARLTLMD